MKHKEFKEQFNAIKNSFNEAFFFKKAKMEIRYEKCYNNCNKKYYTL